MHIVIFIEINIASDSIQDYYSIELEIFQVTKSVSSCLIALVHFGQVFSYQMIQLFNSLTKRCKNKMVQIYG